VNEESAVSKEPVGAGELSSVSKPARLELPVGRSIERVIDPEKLGARVGTVLLVRVDAEVDVLVGEAVVVVVFAPGTESLPVEEAT